MILRSILSLAFAAALCAQNVAAAGLPLAQRYQNDINVLAGDKMEGRGIGTAGLGLAADFIEARLKSVGLKPAFGKSYRQQFPIKTGVTLVEGNELQGITSDQWIPLGFSSSGEFSGPLAFVGYGISAPPIGYDELADVDVKGKVVLMLRYEPQEKDEASPFDGRKPSRWSAVRYRVHQARERGAAAVIFVTGPLQDEDQDKLPALKNDGPESPAGIPVIQVKRSVAQKWLDAAKVDLKSFQEAVDRDLTPRSVADVGVRVSGKVALKNSFADAQNVAGIIPGKGALANEIVVLGAHYDHLGYGGQGSMTPNVRAIHNGADDNASGTVAVLLAAENLKMALAASNNHRTVLVTLFAGEEVGLAGSSYLVAHPPVALDQVKTMVNLDMVGRMKENKLVAFGAESASEWPELLKRLAAEQKLDVSTRGDGYGPSDQTSFYAAKIPVIHFFTGTHEQYHSPADKPDTINAEGGARVVEYTSAVVRELATTASEPKYARVAAAPAMEGDSRGYGAYLGTIPDYSAMEDTKGGVLLSDVRTGGPADLAGIKGGDRIVSLAGTKIENLYDMTYALQDHKPGQTVDVIVLRKGQTLTLRATLGARKSGGEQKMPAAAPPHQMPPEAPKAPAAVPSQAPPATAMAPAASAASGAFVLPKFYEGRPGKDFVIGAGKPFGQTFEGEKHLRDVRQLTFGGENAEAYFSPDGKKLIFQSTPRGAKCDQQYIMDLATGEVKQVSDGKGRTTCGYYDWPEGDRIIYSSTEEGSPDCPPPADMSKGYTWAIYDSYDIFEANPDGSNRRNITKTKGYDAEATWCHRGGKVVFTSDRDGDLDLYEMDEVGNVRRLTNTPGYDGGAFYSADCSAIVWRASRPTGAAMDDYKALFAQHLVRPTSMEIYVMDADGSNVKQLTSNGAANFAPYFHPDGNRIVYASNIASENRREFDIWMVDKRGGEPERVTFAPGFDGFPIFSPDGQYLVFGSNRAAVETHETNLFIARWVD